MTIRALRLAAILGCGGAAAGPPAECAAQTGSGQRGTPLGAAIEEARRSPFHAASVPSAIDEALPAGVWGGAAKESRALQDAPQLRTLPAPVVVFTFLSAGVSHLVGSYLLFSCIDDDSYRSPIVGCIVGPVIPFPAVAAPAAGSELGARKAFTASAFGWLGGAALFSVTMLASDRLTNIGAGLISGAAHALVTLAVLRRP